jgi:hypothetical protein
MVCAENNLLIVLSYGDSLRERYANGSAHPSNSIGCAHPLLDRQQPRYTNHRLGKRQRLNYPTG